MVTAHLLLFSRAPVAGATKSRLAAAVGDAAARDFHVACLRDAVDEALAWQAAPPPGVTVRLHAVITPADSAPEFDRAGAPWPPAFAVHPQAGDSLGARMAAAFAAVLAEQSAVALLLGTDLPLLRRERLGDAVAALASHDAVFGPTPDGGYYLVGLRRSEPRLFEGPDWGRGTVLRQSLDAAAALGLRAATLPPLPDVDVAADVAAVLAHPDAAALSGRRAIRLLRDWVAQGRV